MESEIKCLECGKITRKAELGKLFYDAARSLSTIIVKKSIICPKCKKDISDEKCAVKTHEIMMKLIVANLCRQDGPVPRHLMGSMPLTPEDYQKAKTVCATKLKLVKKF